MDSLAVVIKSFENFIKRSLLPSSSFLMMYMLFDIYANDGVLLAFLQEKTSSLMLITILIIFTGLSTFLTIFHQFIYDNNLKENYDGLFLFKADTKNLKTLREKVIESLKIEKTSDYLLYQTLGRKAKKSGNEINTSRYVDDVKTIGIFFVSLIIMIIITSSKYLATHIWDVKNIIIFILTLLLLGFFYKLGKELILSKYRSRAIRIYTNYLEESN
jgi:hypothetical protein